MNNAESKLFGYLSGFPKLSGLVGEYGALYRRHESLRDRWVIGHGFKPANPDRLDGEEYDRRHSELVANSPYLPISGFRALAQGRGEVTRFKDGLVHRRGFERGFAGPRILVPRRSEYGAA